MDEKTGKNINSKAEREKTLEKTENPYVFKYGEITVKVKYAENGPTFEECFKEFMDSLDI